MIRFKPRHPFRTQGTSRKAGRPSYPTAPKPSRLRSDPPSRRSFDPRISVPCVRSRRGTESPRHDKLAHTFKAGVVHRPPLPTIGDNSLILNNETWSYKTKILPSSSRPWASSPVRAAVTMVSITRSRTESSTTTSTFSRRLKSLSIRAPAVRFTATLLISGAPDLGDGNALDANLGERGTDRRMPAMRIKRNYIDVTRSKFMDIEEELFPRAQTNSLSVTVHMIHFIGLPQNERLGNS